ncbi:hypothetical protein [Hankyongella ginsenosidimutans]|uniref:hypothetical protein n=1 Tax=Hankyongella ginsenosidimutans TaxID=1763828 RepID=UPI001CA30E71|nr:hypothetical protein [Hankyongella ginsenosidimutans]
MVKHLPRPGVGETLTPTTLDAQPWVLLVKPPQPMPTPAVFGAYKASAAPFTAHLADIRREAWCLSEISALHNDLAVPACQLNPDLGRQLALLAQTPEVQLSRLSGSGPTSFALYPDALSAQAAKSAFSPPFRMSGQRYAAYSNGWPVIYRFLDGARMRD